jgi:folate-binding protein YgfZ
MNEDWKAVLLADGAQVREQRVSDFGDPPAELRLALAGDVRCDLSHYGLIAVSGDDAAGFLQGQLTADLRELAAGRSRLAAWCSPKGRMLASMRVLPWEQHYLLRLPAERLEFVQAKLRLYVLRAQVQLKDVSAELLRVGVSGPGIPARLQALGLAVPEAVDELSPGSGLVVTRVPGLHPRFEIIGQAEAVTGVWQRLEGARAVGADAWGLLDTLSGVPEVYPETAELFVPQMANLELLGGVSFTKGCYTGQEVVARTQHLGKLKRRMFVARLAHGVRPRPGGSLRVAGETPGTEVGRVVAAYPDGSGGWMLLAVLQVAAARDGNLIVEGAGETTLVLQQLPYSVPLPREVSSEITR